MRYFILFLSLLSQFSLAQVSPDTKRDYNWVFGYPDTVPNSGTSVMNFSFSPPSGNSGANGIHIFCTNASISDTNGNLLFYTNGKSVADSSFHKMPHGDSLNFNSYYDVSSYGYALIQGAVILPFPEHPDRYLIFHEREAFLTGLPSNVGVDGLFLTRVDMSLNNGLGDVIPYQKNIPVLTDTLDYGMLTAVRHGNGRDWWIIGKEMAPSNCFFKILLTPSGQVNYGPQCIGNHYPRTYYRGQATFSADGSIYARCFDTLNFSPKIIEVYDFNRCNGVFSNCRAFSVVAPAISTFGLSVSPDAHYLYFTSKPFVAQYDLTAADIASTQQIIALGGTDTSYLQSMTGPDGKIYICQGLSRYLSVIHNPNNPGPACNFQFNAYLLPTKNRMSIPYLPDFRLGRLMGSVCDSLTVSVNESEDILAAMTAYPNPARTEITFLFQRDKGNDLQLKIIDSFSRVIRMEKIDAGSESVTIDVSSLPAGIYLALISEGHENGGCCRFCVIK